MMVATARVTGRELWWVLVMPVRPTVCVVASSLSGTGLSASSVGGSLIGLIVTTKARVTVLFEIGRASCRERVLVVVVAVAVEMKMVQPVWFGPVLGPDRAWMR